MFFKTDLERYTQGASTIDEFIAAFEKMCRHRNSVVDDFVFAESGNFEYSGKKEYYFSLVRQYKDNVFSDVDTQTRLDLIFPAQDITFKNRRKLKMLLTSEKTHGSFRLFFSKLRESAVLHHIQAAGMQMIRFEITEEEV